MHAYCMRCGADYIYLSFVDEANFTNSLSIPLYRLRRISDTEFSVGDVSITMTYGDNKTLVLKVIKKGGMLLEYTVEGEDVKTLNEIMKSSKIREQEVPRAAYNYYY